ncbi:MAG: GntR family transcriptional regulator [Actinophytocola sp.]|uniref:GntR family transcriptional regulator n=1 Tax=Actinophytocola sp. TaxID=1872138 RepID=UPI003D6A678E
MRTEAAYAMLARTLRGAILRGRYADGSRLPTEAELATEYRVSRQTVRRAFHDLVAEGMVRRVPGRGTFAAPRPEPYLRQFGSVEDLLGLSLDTQLEVLSPLRRQVDIDAASRLRLDGDAVYRVLFRRRHHDVAFCLTTVYLPPDIGDALAGLPELSTPGTLSEVTVIGMIDAHTGSPVAEAAQSITAAAASDTVTVYLDCEPGDPLLRVDRSYTDTSGRLVELATSYFLPEHYSYRVRLRRGPR